MDIAGVTDRSIRVRGKNASFVFNPEKTTSEISIFTQKPDDYSQFLDQIVIDAPGEYEAQGVSIKCEKYGNGLSFEFFEDGQKLVILSSPEVASSSEVEDATAIVVFLDSEKNDVSKITGDIVVVVGSEEQLPQDKSNIKKADKINLKRGEEYKGYIVHLAK